MINIAPEEKNAVLPFSGRFDRGGGDGTAESGFQRLVSRREGAIPERDDGVCLSASQVRVRN